MRLIYDKLQEAFHIDSQNLSEVSYSLMEGFGLEDTFRVLVGNIVEKRGQELSNSATDHPG